MKNLFPKRACFLFLACYNSGEINKGIGTMEHITEKDPYRLSRLMYILQAALEYFVSIMVAGAFLAKVTASIGMSDALTGILSAFVSLGCGMQIFAVLLTRKKRAKRMVVTASVINQLLFALVYLVPFFPENFPIPRSMILLVGLLLAHTVMNIVHSPKINWFMSLVDDHHRGAFTAKKEIVSLIGGVVFNLAMGAVIDTMEASGNQRGAFLVCAVTLLGLTVLHTVTMLLAKEKERDTAAVKTSFRALLLDKNLLKVILFSVLCNVFQYVCTPFLGAYEIGELGFSMTFIALLSTVASFTRAGISLPMGRFADKHSFASALIISFVVRSLAFFAVVLSSPTLGKYLFPVYTVLNAVSLAGINSGTINLVYDYVPGEGRVAALALQNAVAGVAGFLTTLAVSPLVTHIQASGNTFLGLNLHAQQVLALIALLGNLLVVLYLIFVVKKMKRIDLED